MRALLTAAAMLALPAVAQAEPAPGATIADQLPAPEQIDRGAEALGRAVDGLMQVDVGPVVDAIEPSRSSPGERRTLGDMARRDDPNFDEHLHRSIDRMASSMALLRSRMHQMEPALRRSHEDIARTLDDATRDLHSDRYDRDYQGGDY